MFSTQFLWLGSGSPGRGTQRALLGSPHVLEPGAPAISCGGAHTPSVRTPRSLPSPSAIPVRQDTLQLLDTHLPSAFYSTLSSERVFCGHKPHDAGSYLRTSPVRVEGPVRLLHSRPGAQKQGDCAWGPGKGEGRAMRRTEVLGSNSSISSSAPCQLWDLRKLQSLGLLIYSMRKRTPTP